MGTETKRGKDTYKRKKVHLPTPETRQKVANLTGMLGLPRDDVAACLRISANTLTRHYKYELLHGRVEANLSVAKNMFLMAQEKGNFQAAKYWLGTRCGWSEKPAEPIAVRIDPGPDWSVLFKPQAKDD